MQAAAIAVLALLAAAAWPTDANARHGKRVWARALTTWYGPGFYGNNFACEGRDPWTPSRYRYRTRGVAHRWLPCGTKLTLRHRSRKVHVRVIDRGPYSAATFDLTARTAMDLVCGVRRSCRPYTVRVWWKRGWRG